MHYMIRSAALAASFVASVSLEAATVYDIQFFDQSRSVLGSGRFTTDPNASICVEQNPQADCSATPLPPHVPGLVKKNPLIDFSADIQGVPWTREIGTAWWAAPDQAVGYQTQSRTGPGIAEGIWLFGDTFLGTRTLNLKVAQANAAAGSGTWNMLVYPSTGTTFITGTGNWVATPVPLPPSSLLLLSALLASLWMSTKPRGISVATILGNKH